jgi:hypothetical protein
MESSSNYDFSIFKPRNLHGRKNRNVVLIMLLIWAVAVFGFQFLLWAIEKPTPEKALTQFEAAWPAAVNGTASEAEYQSLLNSLVLVKGKGVVTEADQDVLAHAISTIAFLLVPDSIQPAIQSGIAEQLSNKEKLSKANDQNYLALKSSIVETGKSLVQLTAPYSGLASESLEAKIMIASLKADYPESLSNAAFLGLPAMMKLYLTHNQSVLTDTKFLGFPFHYFYTAVFLLVLFVGLCIAYNLIIQWRLEKEGVVE